MKIEYRWLDDSQLHRIRDLDRSEHIQLHYRQRGAEITTQQVDWDVPNWTPSGESDHSVSLIISFCSQHVQGGSFMRGAFSSQRMVGLGIVSLEIRPYLAQLAFLHVSRDFRRQGIGSRLLEELMILSSGRNQKSMYVSATPSGSAVGFYQRHGFTPAKEPLEELFALEPEDIHRVKPLDSHLTIETT